MIGCEGAQRVEGGAVEDGNLSNGRDALVHLPPRQLPPLTC
jgi:hypothetical protein